MTSVQRTANSEIVGFTLIELLVTISILGVLVALAIPSYRDATLGSRLRAMSNQLIGGVRLARSESFKRNATVTLCSSTDGTNCNGGTSWHNGWIVVSGSSVLLYQAAAPSGFRLTASNSQLIFQPVGVGTTTDSFTACRKTPSVGKQERVITVDTTGRTSLARTATGVCP